MSSTPESMEVVGSQAASTSQGQSGILRPARFLPSTPQPCMLMNPNVANLVPRRGRGFAMGPTGRSPGSSRGITARQIQEALVSHRLAQAVGEFATIKIRDTLDKALFPGQEGSIGGQGSRGITIAGSGVKARLGNELLHGRIIKTGRGGARGGRGSGPSRNAGGGGNGQLKQSQPRRSTEPRRRWGRSKSWGRETNREALDAELDRYAAERDRLNSASLDRELDLYHASAATSTARLAPATASSVGSDDVFDKMCSADDSCSSSSTQESGRNYSLSSTQEDIKVLTDNTEKSKDVNMEDDGDDFDDDLLIDEDV